MTINTIRGRLLASTMIGGVALAAATALPVAAVMLAPTVASAQDYTTGAIGGTVADQSGAPIAGASVTIKSNEQGFTRTTTSGANGAFRTNLLPQGRYTVSVSAPGYGDLTNDNVVVTVGGSTSFTYTLGSTDSANTVDDVVVVGTRPELDFTQTTSGLTVNVAELIKTVPLNRSVTAVALLAPGVIQGDSDFGDVPSLGGSSAAENAFYVNGLNITNFNNYVGGAPVPFDFYRTVDVQTGGYPAEFGRATGGILNAVTKSGTNDFMFALHGNYAPNSLRETVPNVANPTGSLTTPFNFRNEANESESWSLIAEAGGPIWRDHLYAYGLYQWQESRTQSRTGAANYTTTITKNDIPFWGAKIDAYLTDTQHLEYTYFNTEGTYGPQVFNRAGAYTGGSTVNVGGENWVARYTGNFTNWLTLSAAYGVNQDQSYTLPLDTVTPYAVDYRNGGAFRIPGSNVSTGNALLTTERKFYRFDGDLTFSAMGDHHVRFGMDNEDTTLIHGTERTGGRSYFYYSGAAPDGTPSGYAEPGSDYLAYLVSTNGRNGAPVKAQNRAFYIQDSWDITDDFNVQVGLRHDQFKLDNLAGEQVIDLKDNWGPRIAFNLDPFGNGVDKFYGSFGRYFIPVASNLSYRGADLYYYAYFQPTPTGGNYTYNADGTPIGGLGTPLANAPHTVGLSVCPVSAPGGAAGTNSCDVFGDGTQEPADSKYAEGTKATNEDEFIVGYERQLNDLWSVGAAITYRKLNNVSEDIAVDYLVRQYCDANIPGISSDASTNLTLRGECYRQYNGEHDYIIANPGGDLTFLVRDAINDGTANGVRPTLTFSAADVGLPKPRREYTALDLTFKREFDGKWSLNGSYTLSKSEGNYEGTILSDNGQTDAGSTILYDHYGLTDGTYGLLPNHRGHQFKLFGSYQLFDGFTIGANYSLISPRHFGCLGVVPEERDPLANSYGASGRYCFDQDPALPDPVTGDPHYDPQLIARGSQFTTDWISTFDLSLRYTLPTFGMRFVPEGGVTLRADVFNVFDEDSVTDANETGTSGNGQAANPSYMTPRSFQSPRYVRLGFDIAF